MGIIALNLSSNNLNGTLPASIANLTALSIIHLHNNSLQKSIPSQLFNLRSLIILNLGNNIFSGQFILPNIIINNSLQQIHLNDNELTGTIPSSLFNFPFLEVLKLQNNAFSGSIPSNFTQANNLQFAFFDRNNLNGAIPFLPPNLIGVTFHQNDFSLNNDDGHFLFDFLCNLNSKHNLEAITLYNNRNLHGNLCPFNASKLDIFMAHSCQISGTIPSSTHFV